MAFSPVATSSAKSEANSTTVSQSYVTRTLIPVRPLGHYETLWLRVRTGPLLGDAIMVIADAQGNPLGRVMPFGQAARQSESTHPPIRLPQSVVEGPITLKIWIEAGGARRRPTAKELLEIELITEQAPR